MRIGVVAGTRPEFIKILPLHAELARQNITTEIIYTGQHDLLVTEYLEDIPSQDLREELTNASLPLSERIGKFVQLVAKHIAASRLTHLVVQGDTGSALAGAIAGSISGARLIHLEAGLRTGDHGDPWPEEIIRKAITQLAEIHLAPTRQARKNLIAEGVKSERVFVTGNTSIDGLMDLKISQQNHLSSKQILITLHRSEGHGISRIAALRKIAYLSQVNPDLIFLIVQHPNPKVMEDLDNSKIKEEENCTVIQPLGHRDFLELLAGSLAVISDSGGVQEEAPSLGIPLFVARDKTERPEGVEEGFAKLAGKDLANLTAENFLDFINSFESRVLGRPNPYGAGDAAQKAVAAIVRLD